MRALRKSCGFSLTPATEREGFELFVTADQELRYQQNMTGRRIALLVSSTNNWEVVKAWIAEIAAAINVTAPGSFVFVDIGHAKG